MPPSVLSLAAALEHAPAGRAELGHIGDQAGFDPFLIRDGIAAKPEGVALAGRPFFFCVALTRGRGSERDPTQNDPQTDHFPHRSAPVTAACCGQQLWKVTPLCSLIRVACGCRRATIHRSSQVGGRFSTNAEIPSSASRAS